MLTCYLIQLVDPEETWRTGSASLACIAQPHPVVPRIKNIGQNRRTGEQFTLKLSSERQVGGVTIILPRTTHVCDIDEVAVDVLETDCTDRVRTVLLVLELP